VVNKIVAFLSSVVSIGSAQQTKSKQNLQIRISRNSAISNRNPT
jgi:hypothetical protein